MAFAEKLHQLREQAGFSQAELAREAGLSLRSIQNWEQRHREPRAQPILALARALGVAAETVLGELSDRVRPIRHKTASRQRKGR